MFLHYAALLSGGQLPKGRLRGAVVCRAAARAGLRGTASEGTAAGAAKKTTPGIFANSRGVNDVCQFMALISGVDIVCDDYMAK